MDQSLGNRDRSALGLRRRQFGRRFVRLLWTNNPFYLISAWLVFSGLRASFNTGGETFETWGLLGGLAAYTLLLATAACVLVRLGRIWEDIRTLVLVHFRELFRRAFAGGGQPALAGAWLDDAKTHSRRGGFSRAAGLDLSRPNRPVQPLSFAGRGSLQSD